MGRPSLTPTASTPRSQRLGYYLLGLAIGLMLVGLIVSSRQRAMNAPPPGPPGAAAPPAVLAPAPAPR